MPPDDPHIIDDVDNADDIRFMDLALGLAREAAERGEVPVGAVVTREGEPVGSGSNRMIADRDPTAHAEIGALRTAAATLGNYRLTGTTLYVTLEPCAMCAMAMVHARIDRLVFASEDPRTGAAGSVYTLTDDVRLNHRIEVTRGVGSAESARLLRRFFSDRRSAPGSGHAVPNPDISL